MDRFTGILGILAILLVSVLFSKHRRSIRLSVVLWGVGLQLTFAFIVLRTPAGFVFKAASDKVNSLIGYSFAGSKFVFGDQLGGSQPVIFAFQVLPIIIFISSLFSILYYLGVMQVLVRGMAIVMQRVMGASGAESTNVAASIFMGQTEAPLTIRPFLAGLTESELFTIMTSGMAHVSGGIMAMYISQGVEARHLLSAVIMTSPGTILLAKMLVPETEVPATEGKVVIPKDEMHADENFIGAIARGTIDGGQLAFNVAIMLISFLALVGLVNACMLGISNSLWAHGHIPFPHSLGNALGTLASPVAWLIGIPWNEAQRIGNLLGTRAVLNEFVAYTQLGLWKSTLTPRTFSIATFALCGFANLGSIGMQIGGIGALVPNRRNDLARLGFRAMLAGTMANLMSASIVSMLIK
jgi:CNT family concentrative nucleoside transporter